MNGIQFFDKLNLKAARIFTIFCRRSFGAFGRGSLVYFPNYLHNTKRMYIGDNVRIMPGCWLMTISEWEGYDYNGKIYIGSGTTIAFDIQISACSTIRIGKNCCIGRGTAIVDHIHDYRILDRPIQSSPITDGKPIVIEDDVFIGVNCVIAPGVHIGRHTFVGANSVVIEDLPSYAMATGNPAKAKKRWDPETGIRSMV